MSEELKLFISDIIADLDIQIEKAETGQEELDVVIQPGEYQFFEGQVEAYTHIQEVFCSILEKASQ